MSSSTKLLLGVMILLLLFNLFKESIFGVKKADIVATKQVVQERMAVMNNEELVNVYFLTLSRNNEPIFHPVKRVVEKDGDALKVAVSSLLSGPTHYEKQTGIYSEVPLGTKLLSLTETDRGIIVDVSSDFGSGGGADSTYSRVKQLIKTINANSKGKAIYLHINGAQADVIGAEGIMITQPLSEASLDG